MSAPLHSVFFVSLPSLELGPEGQVMRLLRAWNDRGHRSVIASLQGDGPAGARERRLGELPLHVLTPHGKEILRSYRIDGFRAVRRFVEEHRPKLVFALESLVDYHVKLGLIGRKEPIITLLCSDRWKWEKKLVRRAIVRRMARKSAGVIANGSNCLRSWERVVGSESFAAIESGLLRNPVDPSEFAPRYLRRADELVVGAFGRLAKQKGFDLLLRAFTSIPATVGGRRVRLEITGSGEDEALLRSLTRELGLESRVTFRGHTSEVGAFLDSIQVLVVPSRWAGLENSALEGMMAGLPTLCTPESGLAELECANELLFCAGDPPSIASALVELLSKSDEERAAIAERARDAIVERLNGARIAADLEQLLTSWGLMSPSESSRGLAAPAGSVVH